LRPSGARREDDAGQNHQAGALTQLRNAQTIHFHDEIPSTPGFVTLLRQGFSRGALAIQAK
jgi:hypothetical protein